MRTMKQTVLPTSLAIASLALVISSGACAHRRQIYDSSDFARRPAVRQRPALTKARSRLADEPSLSRVIDERDDQASRARDVPDEDRD